MLVPRRGVSALDDAGEPFDDPRARAALSEARCASNCATATSCFEEHDLHINDAAFADLLAARVLSELVTAVGAPADAGRRSSRGATASSS